MTRLPPIHLIEPTLVDARGHVLSLVQRVVDAAPERSFHVWAGRSAPMDLVSRPNVRLRPCFRRRLRIVQQFRVCRRLLREEGVTCVSTAGRTDVALMHAALTRSAVSERAFLYVQWFRRSASRMRTLRRVAASWPDLRLGAATESVRAALREAGFTRVTLVPYPTSPRAPRPDAAREFRHVLFAGAARRDKGFRQVVDLVERLAREGSHLPVRIQTGGDYYGKVSASVREDLGRLETVGYAALQTEAGNLEPGAYQSLFDGAVCLQLYDPGSFADRASGVTLDAFAAGAPVVSWEGTWIARQVHRFQAGTVVPGRDLSGVVEALERIAADYATFAENARRAGATLAEEHHPRRLVRAILGEST